MTQAENVRRRAWWAIAAVAIAAVLAPAILPPRPRLLWNASASSPLGLYLVGSREEIKAGEMAVAWVPGPARELAGKRHYLPRNVPLVKHVAASKGDRVCARGKRLLVNGEQAAVRKHRDPLGRPLPWWRGCRRLKSGELFLLSPGNLLAFDGRYFGITAPSLVIGRAQLLWAR